MFQNALLFNPPATFVHDVAEKYLKQFEVTYEKQVASYVRSQLRRSSASTAIKNHNKLAQSQPYEMVDDMEEMIPKPAAKRQNLGGPSYNDEETVRSVTTHSGSNHAASSRQMHDAQRLPIKQQNPAGTMSASEKGERRNLSQLVGQIPASHAEGLLNDVWKTTGKHFQSMAQLMAAVPSLTLAEVRQIRSLCKAVSAGQMHVQQVHTSSNCGSSDAHTISPSSYDSADEKTIMLPQPNSVDIFTRQNGPIATVPHSVSPFMQRQQSPIARGPSALNTDNEPSIPRILAEKRPDNNGTERSDVARPTWSLLTLTPRLPEQNDVNSDNSSPQMTNSATATPAHLEQDMRPSAATPVPMMQDAEAWSQFRTQNQLREQREQIRAKNLEEKRAMLEAAERQRIEHMQQLRMEALRLQEEEARRLQAMREEEQRRLESEREAIHRRMAGDAEPKAEEEEEEEAHVTDIFAELQRTSGLNGSLLQLDSSLLMDDYHSSISDRSDDTAGL